MKQQPTILVTGAGGFLGQAISRHFEAGQCKVIKVGRRATSFIPGSNSIHMDVNDKKIHLLLQQVQPDMVFHFAGRSSVQKSFEDSKGDYHDSVDSFENLLEGIRQYSPAALVVYASSAAVYGNPQQLPISEEHPCSPLSPYGYHRYLCEIMAAEYSSIYQIRTVGLRIFSAYGVGLRRQVIYDLMNKFLNPQEKTVKILGTGAESRDFVHVADVVQAIKCIIQSSVVPLKINIGTGTETRISELVQLIRQVVGSDKTVVFSGATRQGDPNNWCADISLLESLGFKTSIDLSQGIQQVRNYLYSYK